MVVKDDLYDIANRVKEIDPAYFIQYDTCIGQYELHSHKVSPTYVLSFPFKTLDARALDHTLRTRYERCEQLMKEIEDENLKQERDALDQAKRQASTALERGLSQC